MARRALSRSLVALGLVVALALGGVFSGCNHYDVLDAALWPMGAPTAMDTTAPRDDRWLLLAGDLHCHVSPPDHPRHVDRSLEDTLVAAHDAGIDFLALTPHLWDGFETDASERRRARARWQELEGRVARGAPEGLLVTVGLEYSTRYGHFGMSFGDLGATLDAVSAAAARRDRDAFFETWQARGGLLIVNHPLLLPLNLPVPSTDWDLSFKPWTRPGVSPGFVERAGRRADGVEAYNVIVDELRDRFLQLNAAQSRGEVMAALDERIVSDARPYTPVGGSDSHSSDLRPTMFVLAEERSLTGVRDAIAAGRVCVGHPDACSLRVRPASATDWSPPGSALPAGPMLARAYGDNLELLVDGQVVATPAAGEEVALTLRADRCHVLRLRLDDGASGQIRVGCASEE
jgi:hypothetical protein